MKSLNPFVLRAGGPAFMPYSTDLQAGPLSLSIVQGEVRCIRLGEVEILRRIYLALRGPDWRTIPSVLSDLKVEAGVASFKVSYVLGHRQDEFDFSWTVSVEGDRDGRISFLAKGRSASSFAANRVGLCVLHPVRECAGRPVRWSGPDGTQREGRFPDIISPQEPFKEIQGFSHQLESGAWVELSYQGDVFEMEDQRNWTDGSFKTYCPPADRPKPVEIGQGWETVQGVTLEILSAEGVVAASRGVVPEPVVLRLGEGGEKPLPSLGMGLASHGRPAGSKDAARLRSLKPSHLRADFFLDDPELPASLANAAAQAALLDVPLEAALVVGEDVDASLAAFVGAWRGTGCKAVRWLIFHGASDSTPIPVLEAAIRHLRGFDPGAEFALGSKSDFVLLNRGRPAAGDLPPAARLAFAMCPQVHAFDSRNLVESLEGQEWALRTARALWPGKPPAVSTISLKRSPFAASLKQGGIAPDGAWLNQADPRQVSLLAAAWTLASIKRLAEQGAASATFYQTTGPLGLMAGETTAPEERDFPGVDYKLAPDWVFPLFHVFADLADFKGGRTSELIASHPLRCDGLALRSGSRRAILLASLEGATFKARIEGLSGPVHLRRMNDRTVRLAVEDAEAFRTVAGESVDAPGGALELDLAPYEYIRIDL